MYVCPPQHRQQMVYSVPMVPASYAYFQPPPPPPMQSLAVPASSPLEPIFKVMIPVPVRPASKCVKTFSFNSSSSSSHKTLSSNSAFSELKPSADLNQDAASVLAALSSASSSPTTCLPVPATVLSSTSSFSRLSSSLPASPLSVEMSPAESPLSEDGNNSCSDDDSDMERDFKDNGTGVYLCKHPSCGETFTTRFSLKRHSKKHTGERPHVCHYPNCDSRFAERSTLKRHIRIHTGEKPYVCKYPGCLKSFADRTNVKRHQMIHTGIKPFSCSVPSCGRTFSRKSYLRRHTASFHSGLKIEI